MQKVGSEEQNLSFLLGCQLKVGSEEQALSLLLQLSAKTCF